MKKSFYAAIFSAALSTNALAEAPAQENTEQKCIQINATSEFCTAADQNAYMIETPEGASVLSIPGSLTENGDTNDNCLLIVDPKIGPLAVACAEEEQPAPAGP